MKLAINISGAAKCLEPLTFFEKVAFAKNCGVDAIELHPYKEWPGEGQFPFAGVEAEEAKRIRECCAALNGLSIHALMGQTFSSDDPALRDEAIAGNKLAIRQAEFLGSHAVVVHCRMEHIDAPAVWERVEPVLLDLAEYGAERGVRVCLETPTDLRDPTHFLSIFECAQHPNLGATLDTGHLLSCLDDEAKPPDRVADAYNGLLSGLACRLLAMGKLFHVHLNDIVAATLADHYGIGLGFVDFSRVLGEMQRRGYDGLLAMEIHRGPDGLVGSLAPEGFRQAAAHVRSLCTPTAAPTRTRSR